MRNKTPMTVAELILVLTHIDPEALVFVECDDYCYSGSVTKDDLETGYASNVCPTYLHPGNWGIVYEATEQTPDCKPALFIRAEG